MVQLVPMSKNDFEAYLKKIIPEYAADNVRAGDWSEEQALERSRKAYEQLLPQGVRTEHNYLFRIQIEESGEYVGMLWMKHEAPRPHGFLFEIFLEEAQRGKGYGRQAMLALEEVAKNLGIETIGLHVFAHNSAAMRLYQGLGYEVTSQNMAKRL